MKRTKKMLLAAVAAMAAMAIAGPASASAANWTVAELQKSTHTSYSGTISFQVSEVEFSGGVICEVKLEATLIPTNTGSIYSPMAQSCETTGDLAVCEPESANHTTQTSNLPTGFSVKEESIDLAALLIEGVLGNCPQSEWFVVRGGAYTGSPITLTPDSAQAIGTLTVSGTGEIEEELENYEAQISGTLKADQPGKYGIAAGHWIDNEGEALQKSTSVAIKGSLDWSIGTNYGMKCTSVQGNLGLLTGGKAEMGALEVDPKSCVNIGHPVYSNCQIYGDEAWAVNEAGVQPTAAGKVHLDSFLFFTGMDIWNTTCPWEFTAIEDELTMSPDNSKAISTLSFKEEVSAITPLGEPGAGLHGSFEVTPAGKYGIG